MKPDLRAVLAEQIIIGDGAMGTYLYQMGFPVGISYEEFNLTKPEHIAEVHKKYVQAGAQLIETNTFSANREKLSKYGLDAHVSDINRAGVKIAKKTAGDAAYVVGAVGSIRAGKRQNIRTAEVQENFLEQIEALLAEGVDGLLFETFYDLEELILAVGTARKLGDIPLICQFATEGGGSTHDGVPLTDAFLRLLEHGADVVGFNCRSGPNGLLRSLDTVQSLTNVPFSIFPNAGLADYVDGQYTYAATPEYFGESALKFAEQGARIIGGCCGTTPEHIAAAAESLQGYKPGRKEESPSISQEDQSAKRRNSLIVISNESLDVPSEGPSTGMQPSLIEQAKERHTVIVELDPPRGLSTDKYLEGARALQAVHADAITMSDNSMAVTRMSNMAIGKIVLDETGLRPLVHITCRDRNMMGTQSHLMGLHALGINHVLAVTGDPARFGDLPGSSSVYDLTSFEIIRMIRQLNEGISFSGKPLKTKANFVIGAAFNPNVKNLDAMIKRLERKAEAGADYIMTQPVYSAELIREIHTATRHIDIPIFIGIMPLASGKNAEFLHNEVPGIQLSDEVRKRMAGKEGQEGRKMGTQIAKELLDTAMEYFNGIYLITPFLFYEMTTELTRYVWEKMGRSDFLLSPMSK